MVSGYDNTLGTRNSPEDEVMLVTESMLTPLLLRVSTWSTKDPTHALPKSPASAMTKASRQPAASTAAAALSRPKP